MTALALDALNAMDAAAFTAALGDVFEHSPWIAREAAARRPYASVDALHAAMVAVVDRAGADAQLALIRAHPELAGRAAIRGEITETSTREQRGAGLDQCSPEEFATLTALNHAYRARFNMPFVVAVKGLSRTDIIAAMRARLDHAPADEIAEALRQIARIARFRLDDRVRAG